MEKWAGVTFDLRVHVLIFAGKIKNHHSGIFLWGKQKALQTILTVKCTTPYAQTFKIQLM